MAGRVQWEAQVDSNIKQLLGDAKQLRDELDGIKKGKYEVKLNIDEKKLENVISNLDKMLTSLGKGAGDFKEFENLSNQLKDIVSEVQLLNKAFGGINDKGASNLLSAINNIDKSLSSLNEHIIAVNKDFGNVGKNVGNNVDQINEARKATEGLADATKDLKNAQKNIDSTLSKSYKTKNKTEAYNQLKQASDVFKNIYGNEEIMSSKAGAEAAYAYYKSYEEALKKGIAKSKLEKATVDVNDDFFNAERISSIRIDDFSNFKKYGGDLTDLSLEISKLEEKLLKFNDAYSKVYNALGNAPITPEIIKNIEEYVRNLEIAESRTRNKNLLGFTDEDIDIYKNASDMYLDFALEDAVAENKKYISSLEEIQRNAEKIKNSIKDINADKLNISSGLTDTIQDDTDKSNMESVASATEEAVQAKKDFATANEGVQSSVDGSKSQLELEAELMSNIAKSAREAADAKKEFVEANKEVKDSTGNSNDSLKKDKYKDKSKISEEDYTARSDYFASIANKKLTDSGKTILGNNVNTELVDGLVKVNAKIKEADGTWKTFSAKIDADGNMFEQRFRTITKNVDKLDKELKDFELDSSPALSYGETLEKAKQIRESLNLGDEFTVKVDSNELVTITKKLDDVNSSAISVTQTFKSAQDAIDNFGKETSNIAEKTSVALKNIKEKKDNVSSNTQTKKDDAQSSVNKALKDQIDAWKKIQNIREKIAKSNNSDEISALNESKESYQKQYDAAEKVLKANSNLYDEEAQLLKIEQIRLETNAKIAKYKGDTQETTLSSAEESLNKFQNKLSSLELKPDVEHRFPKYTEYINELSNAIEKYSDHIALLRSKQNNGEIITDEDINQVQEYEENITKLFTQVKKFSGGEKGYENISATKMAAQINKLLEDNTRMSKEAKEQIKAYYAEVASGNPTRPLKEIYNDALKVVQLEKEAGRGGKSFLSAVANKMWYGAAGQIANMFGFYDIINYTKQGINTVRELDTALTEMRKVSDETVNSLKNYQATTFDTADAVGTTAKQIQNSTADWMGEILVPLYGNI